MLWKTEKFTKKHKKTAETTIVSEPETKVCPYCLTEIKYKATKCPNCTSELPIIESSQSQEQPKIEVEE